ncbi:beta strand repeat-containing protein, partial [Flavobacterium macacae]|uniref:beta strand repeat-containing protein n=1 Tax=Flavobacterium macacae TaxID=2488993 RepID=UPI003742E6BD
TVQLGINGQVAITPAQINNGSFDNCGIATLTLDVTTFTCANIGANNVILTITDANGNVSTATAIVTVQDVILPTVITQNISVQLDADGQAVITPAQINNGSIDNCAIASYALDITNFTCANVGANTVTLTVTDVNGNVSTATAIVTVQDLIAPIVITQNISVPLDANAQAVITPAQINNGSTDNCSIATYVLDATNFTCANVGPNTVTLTVTDVNGNVATGTAIVTVQDVILPTAIAQNITVQLGINGQVAITPAQINNGSFDNCGNVTATLDVTTFTCANIGANNVILTITDANGNVSTATAIVTVQDVILPTVITQNISVQLDANGQAVITPAQINNGSIDNCAIASYALDITNFTCANVGANTVTLTVTDVNGNVSTATAIVTVQDLIAPIVITQNISVPLDANAQAVITPAQINNGSTDNCSIATYVLDATNFTCANVGPNTVTLTVTDVNGNVATGTAIVTVQDVILPTAIAQNITVQLGINGQVAITPAQINNGSFDNCGNVTATLDVTTFTCANIGANNVILTITDANGNVSTATAIVTVQDLIAPTVVTQNISVQLDANGQATITPAQINNGSTDNCSIATYVLDVTNFTCANVGPNTVILTVTDVNGNIGTATAIVTVQDLIAPTVITQNIPVQLDANGQAVITPAQINNGSFDNCGIATYTLDIANFTCANVGANTVTLTVTDVNGNISTAPAIVTVQDLIAPIVITQNITVQLGINGQVAITPAQINNGSFDNCGIATLTLDVTNFTCVNVGLNTVILTVTDINANVSTATAVVTVEDNILPTVIAQNITVHLNANGEYTLTTAEVNNGSFDNCGIETLGLSQTFFNCASIGTTTTVTLFAVDVNGNYASATAFINVADTMAPTVITQNISVQLGADGQATITPAQINNGSFDNCGIVTYTLDIASFTCANVGPNTVTLTVTDVNGNVSTGTAIVTVQDLIAPAAISQNITVQLGINGQVAITPAQINNASFDNCGIATLTLDITNFTCA